MAERSGSDRGNVQKGKAKGPAWMGTGTSGPKRQSSAQWTATPTKQQDPEANSRAILGLIIFAAVALFAVFVYFVLTRVEPTPVISLRASAYPLQMPPLAFSEEDANLLGRISPQNVRVIPVEMKSSKPALEDFKQALEAAGRKFSPFRRGSDVVVVSIAAHGRVNEANQPCLVSATDDPFDSNTWLPLAQALKAIRDEKTLQGKHKLVLLDCQRVLSCWRAGWLENRFFEVVPAAIKEADDPKLFVLTAADVGQVNWAAPELRGSVFGHFIARGLRGEASRGSSVSLFELVRYVGDSVNDYSSLRQRRDVRQEPTLWHGDRSYRHDGKRLVDADGQPASFDDFTLAYVDRGRARTKIDQLLDTHDPLGAARKILSSTAAGKDGGPASPALNDVWQRFRQRREGAAGDAGTLPGYVIDPVAWSSIQDRLAAIGERLFAGHEYQVETLLTEIKKLSDDLGDSEAWRPNGSLPTLSYIQAARQETPKTGASPTVSGDNLFSLYLKTEVAKRDEVMPKTVSKPRLVRDVYAALIDGVGGSDARASLRNALELFDRYRQPDSAPLLEEHFLRLLSGGLVPGEPVSSQQLAAALRARDLASRAVSRPDLRIHYPLEPFVNTADDKLRKAEDLFLLGTEARNCETLWKELTSAVTVESLGSGYPAVLAFADRLAACYQLRDEIWTDWPLVAEWTTWQGRSNSFTNPTDTLVKVLESTIDLDDALERAIRSRDESGTFRSQWDRCGNIHQSLSDNWGSAIGELKAVYDTTNREKTYRNGADVCNAEMAMRLPPLVGSSNQYVELYLQTLDSWIAEGVNAAIDTTQDAGRPVAPSVRNEATAVDQDRLLRELHRALDYEFIVPYAQHRHATAWNEPHHADAIFRTGNPTSTWRHLHKLLDAYKAAIASESPAWNSSRRSVEVAANLRQWDRRVRLAGPWLSSFQANAYIGPRTTEKTPARWLQERDAAHWSAWQAYRAEQDFWGNGQPATPAAARPYFASAIDQCESVLTEPFRPIRYDIPTGGIADFAERSTAALTALERWEPMNSPRSSSASDSAAGNTRIEFAIQPQTDGGALRLPDGVATLSLQAPGSSTVGAFDTTGRTHTRAVSLPLATTEPTPITGYAPVPADGTAASQLDARLWFRGHVRAKPIRTDGPGRQFVEYEFTRTNYGPPTVEVRGKDAVRGAVVFVFDCSSSMRANDNRFNLAKQELQKVLLGLVGNAGPDLKVGLMAYGKRTPADGAEPIYYEFPKMHNDPNNLAAAGIAAQMRLGTAEFKRQFPHPDRDLEVCAPVAKSTAADAAKELAKIEFGQCRGCTPLYYSIQQALDHGFEDLPRNSSITRQIVVVSDGVNMPYETYKGSIGTKAGIVTNNADLEALKSAVQRHANDTQVSVVLFGGIGQNPVEQSQLSALTQIANISANFRVFPVPNAAQIEQTILSTFPKAALELRGPETSGLTQPMTFNQPVTVRDWPTDGALRREPVRQIVRVTPPGEIKPMDRELELIGGERVILQYEPREGQSLFIGDNLDRRKTAVVKSQRLNDPRRLLLDALDPERVALTVSKFNFRLRDEDEQHRFAPRPRYVWLEVTPILASGEAADRTFPCIDISLKEYNNLPWLEMPVKNWPECPTARVKAWFRYAEPLASATATISRDRASQSLQSGTEKWRIEQTAGDGGTPRKITAIWEPTDGQPSLQKLLDRAVWLTPPPDSIRRQYAVDGSAAIHEFIYNRPDTNNVEIRIVPRGNFEQNASYYGELEFSTAN